MLKILGRIPKCHFHVACSGGSDSMILLDFLMKYPKNKFDVIHFNHGSEYCDEAENFVREFCGKHGLELHVGRAAGVKKPGQSQEEFWRNERYRFFSKFSAEPILLSHHLNDVIETWVMTSMSGNPMLIPYCNPKYNIYRPFLAVSKSDIEEWRVRHNVECVFDKSNDDISIRRNYVRHVMMEHVRTLNPGIETTIKNKVLAEYNNIIEKN